MLTLQLQRILVLCILGLIGNYVTPDKKANSQHTQNPIKLELPSSTAAPSRTSGHVFAPGDGRVFSIGECLGWQSTHNEQYLYRVCPVGGTMTPANGNVKLNTRFVATEEVKIDAFDVSKKPALLLKHDMTKDPNVRRILSGRL